MSRLTLFADRVLNRPLLITPNKAAVILQVLGRRMGVDASGLDVSGLAPEASRFVGSDVDTDAQGRAMRMPYRRTPDGVAVITITGSLVNRGAYVGAASGLTSYEGIKHQLATAAADPKVVSVILDLQSPGGEAVGAFETAAAVRALAEVKTTIAVVNGMAASAAYAIASGATEIVTTETGVSGSIGVVMLHADYSAQLAEEGIKPTLIFAGAHKVDGNGFEPLPETVRADLQAEVDAYHGLFLRTVAKGRGARLTEAAARATEARSFIGAAAVKAGLADRVGSFEAVLAALSTPSRSAPRRSLTQGASMSATPDPAADTSLSRAEHETALAAARTEARAEGLAAGRAEATARIAAIMAAEGIKGHPARLIAALNLAARSPAMAAEDVAGFVRESVPASDMAAENPANALGDPPAPKTPPRSGAKVDRAQLYNRATGRQA